MKAALMTNILSVMRKAEIGQSFTMAVVGLIYPVRKEQDFSLFDSKFLEEISKMKEKNLAVELLKRLIAEQVHIYKRTNLVKSEKFSEIMQSAMNRYLNGTA